MDLELFGIYKIPIKLMGSSLSLSEKKVKKIINSLITHPYSSLIKEVLNALQKILLQQENSSLMITLTMLQKESRKEIV